MFICSFVYLFLFICFCLFSDADETKNWINEKDKVLSSDDYGKDLASVNALLRKHEAMERDLAAVEDKVCLTRNEYISIIESSSYLLIVWNGYNSIAVLMFLTHLKTTIVENAIYSKVTYLMHACDGCYVIAMKAI